MVTPMPKHVGASVFPNFPVFGRLLGYASRDTSIVINDITNNYSATHIQLLTDVLHLRNVVYDALEDKVKEQLWRGEEVYINLLTPAGYEFAVGFLAILAVGAVIVPLSPALPVGEATYYVRTSRATAVLSASNCANLGNGLSREVSSSFNPTYFNIEIGPLVKQQPLQPKQIQISYDWFLDYHGSGVVIFTSGTTGPPKGAVRRRSWLDGHPQRLADLYRIEAGDVVMHSLPVHHVTGIGTTFMPFILAGATVEFRSGGFDPAAVWERWREGGVTLFSGVPTMYMRLMRWYEDHIAKLPKSERQEYIDGPLNFKALMCGTSNFPRPLKRKWSELLRGKRVLERYGTTEFSTAFAIHPSDTNCPEGSVGKAMSGLDVRLSDGEEGEILIRSPFMFSKYIFNEKATAAAFTTDGFYKTGDIGRREGDYYYILGRASVDILKSGGYKISALDVEREILALDYIAEVAVMGVEDEEFGDRVAAAIVLKDAENGNLTLDKLRKDLRSTLAGYKMPTMLRIVPELPKTASGKVPKKVIKPELFPPKGHSDVQVWRQNRPQARL